MGYSVQDHMVRVDFFLDGKWKGTEAVSFRPELPYPAAFELQDSLPEENFAVVLLHHLRDPGAGFLDIADTRQWAGGIRHQDTAAVCLEPRLHGRRQSPPLQMTVVKALQIARESLSLSTMLLIPRPTP